MMIFVFLALAWLTGLGVLRRSFAGPLRWSAESVLLFSLAAGLGLGITSSLYFAVLALAAPNVILLAVVEGAAVTAAVVLGVTASRKPSEFQFSAGTLAPSYLKLVLVLALASAATMFVLYSLAKPHGEWDAWAIWNLHARFLSRGGQFWTSMFSPEIAWSHPDYPLLLPGAVALFWTLLHNESTAVPVAIAFLFTFGAAGVLITTIGIVRGKTQSLIAGILLLASAGYIENGATQYADIPLSFYILASLTLLVLQDRRPEDSRLSLLAGLAAGFAAWTKNEGLLFLLAVVVARALALFRYTNRAAAMRQLLNLALGIAAPVIIVALFKFRYAPPNDLMSRGWAVIAKNIADPARWVTAIGGFLKGLAGVGSFLIPIALVLALYWYLVRFKVDEVSRPALFTAVLSLSIMLAGDLGAYILLSGDVNWQIGTSFDRLLLQLWPSALLAFFLAANPPQLVAIRESVEKEKSAKKARKPRARVAETR